MLSRRKEKKDTRLTTPALANIPYVAAFVRHCGSDWLGIEPIAYVQIETSMFICCHMRTNFMRTLPISETNEGSCGWSGFGGPISCAAFRCALHRAPLHPLRPHGPAGRLLPKSPGHGGSATSAVPVHVLFIVPHLDISLCSLCESTPHCWLRRSEVYTRRPFHPPLGWRDKTLPPQLKRSHFHHIVTPLFMFLSLYYV